MKKNTIATLLLIIIACLTLPASFAQATKRDGEFTVAGSGSSSQKLQNTGFGANLELGYYLSDASEVSVRQSIGYNGAAQNNIFASSGVAYDYHLTLGRFRPFAGAGVEYLYGQGVTGTFNIVPEIGGKLYVLKKTYLLGRIGYVIPARELGSGNFRYTLGVGFSF